MRGSRSVGCASRRSPARSITGSVGHRHKSALGIRGIGLWPTEKFASVLVTVKRGFMNPVWVDFERDVGEYSNLGP